MIDLPVSNTILAGRLDTHVDAISATWIEQIRRVSVNSVATFSDDRLHALASDGLAVLIDALSGNQPATLVQFQHNVASICLTLDTPIADLAEELRELGRLSLQQAWACSPPDYPPDESVLHWWSSVIDQCTANYTRKLEDHLKTYQTRTATLLRVAKAVSSTLDLEEVLRTIQREIYQILDLYCNSFLISDNGELAYSYTEHVDPRYTIPSPPEDFMLDALRRKEPAYCYDAATDPRTHKPTVQFFDLKSLLAVPFIYRDEVVAVGLMTTYPTAYRRFSQDEIDLMQALANTAASAVANARLHQNTELLAIAQERNRLAKDVHDNLAQTLTILKMGMNELLAGGLDDSTRQTVQEMKDLVSETYVDMRDTIFGLSAIGHSRCNLSAELGDFVDAFASHHGLSIQIDTRDEFFDLIPAPAQMHAIRIIQESLVNVRKHAGAKQVWIKVEHCSDCIEVSVQDDGCGFDLQQIDTKDRFSFGLEMMWERAKEAGGTLLIDSSPGQGTRITLRLPLEEET